MIKSSCPQLSSSRVTSASGLQLNEILLSIFAGDVLGVRLVAERKIGAVLRFDPLRFLVPVRLFSPVEEPGRYRQAGHDHEDHHSDHTCKLGGIYSGILRHFCSERSFCYLAYVYSIEMGLAKQ